MRVPAVLLVLLLLHHHTTCAFSARVHELTPLTIDTYLDRASSTPLLLEFYAPWCGHCSAFESSYRLVADRLAARATVARVDGSRHKLLSMRFRVRAFPTFFLVVGGRVFDFTGPRTVDALVAFADARGAADGKPHAYFFGPLSPYWALVGAAFRALHRLYHSVASRQVTPAQLARLTFAAVAALLLAFVAVIYFVTKPPNLPKPSVPQRPHAD